MNGRKHIMSTSLMATVAVSAMLLSACIPPGPPPQWWNANVDVSAEAYFEQTINNARAAGNRHGLVPHGVLTDKARSWSQKMANNRCSPERICHSQLTQGINGVVASWSLLGENVGIGGNVHALWRAFMNSAPHRNNIMDDRWHYYGVGVIKVGNTYWVTMVFMRL
jgi:uncharacterized protein YkwD